MEDFFSILNVDYDGKFDFISSKKIDCVEIKVLSSNNHIIWQGFMDINPDIIYWICPYYGNFKYNSSFKVIFIHYKEEEKRIEIPEIDFRLSDSLFSNTCTGMQTYKNFNSPYTSPLIGNIFLNDLDYLIFSEECEKITLENFNFVEPRENLFWNQISEGNRMGSGFAEENYPVMNIGDIEIHWIHERGENIDKFIKKWNRRIERSQGRDKIFIWSSSEFLNFHGNIERKKIIDRFKSIHSKSIFLTERQNEYFEDEDHLVFFVEEWDNYNQSQRSDNGTLIWNNQFEISNIFKRIITRKFYLPKYQNMKFRKIEKDDLHFLNEVRNIYAEDFLHDPRKFSIDETTEWFFRENPDYYMIEIGEQRVGYFRISNHSHENKSIYIGADIHPDFTGKGLGYLSYKKFIPFIFEEYDLNKISLEVLSNNHRAIHLYEKIGFTREGVKREEILRGGIYLDSIIMSILKREWK